MVPAAQSNDGAAAVLGLDLEEALDRLRKSEAAMYISPNPSLSVAARAAAAHIYGALRAQVSNPPPLEQLLVDPDSFDGEQVWAQLHLLYRPLFSHQRRHFRRLQNDVPSNHALHNEQEEQQEQLQEEEEEDHDPEDEEIDEADEEEEQDHDEEEEEEDVGDDDEEKDVEEKGGEGVEDRFLRIQDLQDYLEREEAKEYGEAKKQEARRNDDEEEDEGDEDGGFEFGEQEDDDDDDNADGLGDAKYEDFFGGKNKRKDNKRDAVEKMKQLLEKKSLDGSEYLEMNGEQEDIEDDEDEDDEFLSTHEKEQRKLQSTIQQMEKANIEPKSWTMQGEVTAAKRPKNSALEVDLDFEHNVRPAPVITEEVTASLEDLIKKRISEGHFDDVQRAQILPIRAPKERKELDESKSKKSLAEIYEDEYAQTAGLASDPLSTTDQQKKEAGMLFKRICAKLDALAHFHFAPKPVIEDMSIQTNIPALAMEEVAPLAISDAAMLAPEEIFEGKGDIKEEGELTQTDRKRRRANKKRKFKVEAGKREAKKARQNADPNEGREDSVMYGIKGVRAA